LVLSRLTRHCQITIPAKVRRKLGTEEGDIGQIEVIDETAVLHPKRLVDKSQAYFWTEEWQKGEREADEDIRAGRVEKFRSARALTREPDS
jgi:AbrB family looped-hinge helix DNA binding protein